MPTTLIDDKMAELARLEVVEGPKAALNSSDELLTLCSTFVRQLERLKEAESNRQSENMARSHSRSRRHFRDRFLGSRQTHAAIYQQETRKDETHSLPDLGYDQQREQAMDPPTIQVTEDSARGEEVSSGNHRTWRRLLHGEPVKNKLHKTLSPDRQVRSRPYGSNTQRLSSGFVSNRRRSFDGEQGHLAIGISESNGPQPRSESHNGRLDNNEWRLVERLRAPNSGPPSEQGSTPDLSDAVSRINYSMTHDTAHPLVDHDEQLNQQETQLPTSLLSTSAKQSRGTSSRFMEQARAYMMLVRVWLFVAGIYRRAAMFEDSKEACEEASRYTSQFEALVASYASPMAHHATPWWGFCDNLNKCHADVHAERACLAAAKGSSWEAIQQFEEALVFSMDHPIATVGLGHLLLDIYEGKIPTEEQLPVLQLPTFNNVPIPPDLTSEKQDQKEQETSMHECDQYAARDRALSMLSNLTKLDTSSNDPEVWFALSRAHQCSGQIEEEIEALQWCAKSEESRPVRPWATVGTEIYALWSKEKDG